MKKIVIFGILILSLAAGGLFGYNKAQKVSISEAELDLIENPSSIEDLISESETILTIKTGKDNNLVDYKDIQYYLTNSEIKDVHRDMNNLTKKDDIFIFQNNFEDIDPLLEKNTEYLVFLVKMDFPGYENVFRCVGLYKGKFKLTNNSKKVEGYKNNEYSNDKFDVHSKESLTIKLDGLEKKIELYPFAPKHKKHNAEVLDE